MANIEQVTLQEEEEYQRAKKKRLKEQQEIMEPVMIRLDHTKTYLEEIRKHLVAVLQEIDTFPDPYELSDKYSAPLQTALTGIILDSKATTNLANAVNNLYIKKFIPF